MSAWRQNPDSAAAELVRRSAGVLDLPGRVLIANAGPAVRAEVTGLGIAADAWSRRAGEAEVPKPWPEGGPYDSVLLRLAKAKDEQVMGIHAALSVMAPGGRLMLFGGNDEGIKSASALLEPLCGAVETLSTVAHGRVLAARKPDHVSGLRATLSEWREEISIALAGEARRWVVYPGVFSAAGLDEGTRAMLTALPTLGAGARVLDYGCGTGVIAAAMRAHGRDLTLDMLDADTVSLLAATENVPGARTILGTALPAVGATRYDAILSNPPLHSGVAEDHRMLERLVADAPKYLRRGGYLQLVVQRRVPLETLLGEHLSDATIVAETGTYRVWRARALSRS